MGRIFRDGVRGVVEESFAFWGRLGAPSQSSDCRGWFASLIDWYRRRSRKATLRIANQGLL
ncbi:MAG: hypothetical protein P8N76_19780 [Pirellulaceae bacterium]|nr:hypothetical protein [Pirellulaceae bacterium]